MAKFKLEDGSEVEAYTSDEVKTLVENEVAGLKAKRDELLGLHSKDKERLTELEKAQAEAEEARQKEKGEFKSLYENKLAELEKLTSESAAYRKQIEERDLSAESLKLVSELTRDTKRAELLQKEVLQYAKHTAEGVKFEVGGQEVDKETLTATLKESYPFLVDGSGATGGEAKGNTQNGKAIVGNINGSKEEQAAYFASKFNLN